MVGGETIKKKVLEALNSVLPKVAGRKKIVFVDASSSKTVSKGSHEAITIQPPDGKIWRIVGAYFWTSPPAGATSGTHTFILFVHNYGMLRLTGNYSTKVGFWDGVVYADVGKSPDFHLQLRMLKASHQYPFILKYYNNTDADQANPRYAQFIFEEEDEAP